MFNLQRFIVLSVALSGVYAPMQALEKQLDMVEIPAELDPQDQRLVEQPQAKEKKSFGEDVLLVSTGLISLFTAYQLCPQVKSSYERYKHSGNTPVMHNKPRRTFHTLATVAQDAQLAQKFVGLTPLHAGTELAAYSLGTAAFVAFGLVSLARGLHLVK